MTERRIGGLASGPPRAENNNQIGHLDTDARAGRKTDASSRLKKPVAARMVGTELRSAGVDLSMTSLYARGGAGPTPVGTVRALYTTFSPTWAETPGLLSAEPKGNLTWISVGGTNDKSDSKSDCSLLDRRCGVSH